MEDDTLEDLEGVEILVAKDQLIVVAHADATKTEIVEALQEVGGSIVGEIPSIGTYQVELPPGTDLAEAMETLEGSSAVESAFPNVQGETQQSPHEEPNDPWFEAQSYLREIRALEAWEITKGSRNVAIAIVDDGVDEIGDLTSKIVERHDVHTGQPVALPDRQPVTDDDPTGGYHGTIVAGVAAAEPNDGAGMAGVAWNPVLIAVKHRSKAGIYDVMVGIGVSIELGAKIVNVSWSGLAGDPSLKGLERLVEKAADQDVLIVAAPTNVDWWSNPLGGIISGFRVVPAHYAGAHDNVIAVAGTSKGRFETGYGAPITVSAPATVTAYAPHHPSRQQSWTGTSVAAPQVSGLAALIWSLDHETNDEFTLSPAQVRKIITDTATPPPPGETRTGAGVIDARSALERTAELLGVDIAPEPTPTPTPPSGAAADKAALVALYNAADGPNWAWATEGWLTDAPIEEWEGVGTNSNGRVNSLWLAGNRLNGELPPDLGNLLALLMLYLPRNSLTGEIPSALENLSDLQILSLHQNRLSGQIPTELGNLPRLETLRLNDNRLSGQIPPELGRYRRNWAALPTWKT